MTTFAAARDDLHTGDACTYPGCREPRARMPDRAEVETRLRGKRLIYCREHALLADPERAGWLTGGPQREADEGIVAAITRLTDWLDADPVLRKSEVHREHHASVDGDLFWSVTLSQRDHNKFGFGFALDLADAISGAIVDGVFPEPKREESR